MPPKKGAGGPSKKTVEKKKEKVVEDKTFGLKNKKGKKQQDFIKNVTSQVKYGNQGTAKREQDEREKREKKKELEKKKAEEASLFKPVQSQKISAGADPKSVLCAFFKQGTCKKGDKCKFSHDPSVERRGEKRSLYVDERGELENDTMDKWDQEKLEEVVSKKHGKDGPKPTDIVCKHFLDAIDKNLYGWFWSCPGGGEKCHYRHALPPGFVLKKDQKKAAKQDQITIEELVETERSQLGSNLTKITLDTFMEWKKRKLAEKKITLAKELAKKKSDFKAGRALGVSGREMFMFNPELVGGDDDGAEEVYTRRRENDDDNDEEASGACAAAGAASAVSEGPSYDLTNIGAVADTPAPVKPLDNGDSAAAAAAAAAAADAVVVDEDLFGDEDIGDLDLGDLDDDEDEDMDS
ncbi:zinc finger CCCH domain-containing protein 15-like [Sycon ciliatum]|uniref:zinc finger CCCH domain-containing protein 15-like n=1 Tax=Sycon ciliatum TaxID=27933 RepID=UPI0031F6CA37